MLEKPDDAVAGAAAAARDDTVMGKVTKTTDTGYLFAQVSGAEFSSRWFTVPGWRRGPADQSNKGVERASRVRLTGNGGHKPLSCFFRQKTLSCRFSLTLGL